MSRKTETSWQHHLLGTFLHDGTEYSKAEMAALDGPEKSLISHLSFLLLSCRDHICHNGCTVQIEIHPDGEQPGWEISNWPALPPALQFALKQEISRNKVLPTPKFPSEPGSGKPDS